MEQPKNVEEKSLERTSLFIVKSEEETKKLVSQMFYKWINVFGKEVSERMPTKKLWDHAIEVKISVYAKKEKGIFCYDLS